MGPREERDKLVVLSASGIHQRRPGIHHADSRRLPSLALPFFCRPLPPELHHRLAIRPRHLALARRVPLPLGIALLDGAPLRDDDWRRCEQEDVDAWLVVGRGGRGELVEVGGEVGRVPREGDVLSDVGEDGVVGACAGRREGAVVSGSSRRVVTGQGPEYAPNQMVTSRTAGACARSAFRAKICSNTGRLLVPVHAAAQPARRGPLCTWASGPRTTPSCSLPDPGVASARRALGPLEPHDDAPPNPLFSTSSLRM